MYLQYFCLCLQLPEGKLEEVQAEVWAATQQGLQDFAGYPPYYTVRFSHYVMLWTSLQQEVLQPQHCTRSCKMIAELAALQTCSGYANLSLTQGR